MNHYDIAKKAVSTIKPTNYEFGSHAPRFALPKIEEVEAEEPKTDPFQQIFDQLPTFKMMQD